VPDPKKTIQLGVLGKQGRYVRIQLLDKDYLSIAEVQVMGVDLSIKKKNLPSVLPSTA
jgi:hypothetical protein